MLSWSFTLLLGLIGTAYASIASVTPAQWAAFNVSVGGRLHGGAKPIAAPCYSNYNGSVQIPNAAQCATVQSGWNNAFYITSTPTGFVNSNWGICQRTAQGCNLNYNTPADPTYYALGQTCYQGSVEPYYVAVSTVSDVQATIAFVKANNVPLTIKTTGHDYKGRSAGLNTLTLWMYNVQPAITLVNNFIPDGCPGPVDNGVTFGGGQQFDGLYSFANDNNITIVGGDSGTVATAGGWITGGGHSPLSNTLGLGVDNVLQIRAILPNGSYVTANQCQNADLWFAFRGGGGGTFGVNYEMTVRAHPKVTLQTTYIGLDSLNPTQLKGFLTVLIANAAKWASEGWGGQIFPGLLGGLSQGLVLMTPSLTLAQAQLSMKPLTDFVATLPLTLVTHNQITTEDGFYPVYKKYLQTNAEPYGASEAVGSRLLPSNLFTTADGQASVLNTLTTIINQVTFPTYGPLLIVNAPPVQILVVPPSNYPVSAGNDTSSVTPAWRSATWDITIGTAFTNNANYSTIQGAFNLAHSTTEMLRQIAPNSGAYVNEADIFASDPINDFWGSAHYARLQSIKAQVDPSNVLTNWGAIGWDSTDPRYGCYPSLT